jgi:hypothetical protein
VITVGEYRVPQNLVDQAISLFVGAMKMAGVELDPQHVLETLQVSASKAKDGSTFLIAVTSSTNEPLSDGVPLLIAAQQQGVWQWRRSGLDVIGEMIGIPIGVNLWYKDNAGNVINDDRYSAIVRNDFGIGAISAGVGWKWLEPAPGQMDHWSLDDMSGQLEQAASFDSIKSLRLHAVLWPAQYPDWIGNLSPDQAADAMYRHIDYMASRFRGLVQQIDVVNEPYYSGPYSQAMVVLLGPMYCSQNSVGIISLVRFPELERVLGLMSS